MSETKYLSRGIDHLGDLGAKLRDLQGFATLAHELIQNADDVPKAASISFDVCDYALIVDNDGVFSDCQQVNENKECPWKTDSAIEHRCDFHRFRNIASGDKRREADTTGAFGIGFIAVYQITDTPELISGGRHWILHEDEPEDQRIEVCSGCSKCKAPDLPGTRFILPWATNPNSAMRQGLQAEAVSPDAPKKFVEEIEHTLSVAMLFLKRIKKIEVKMNGQIRHAFEREKENDTLILTDGDTANDRIWKIIEGDFSKAAETLRTAHPNKIEEKKSSRVTIAIPNDDHPSGLICAYLPTQQDTKLPFHINADFFTTMDRKRIHLSDGFQSAWNRAAFKAAAEALANSVETLTLYLGHKRFWNFLSALKQVADAERGETAYAEFWKAVTPKLNTTRIVYTTKNEWIKSDDAALLSQKEESAAIPVMEAMGLNIVNEDLRPYQSLLISKAIGVLPLSVSHLCDVLTHDGLIEPTEATKLPVYLSNKTLREALWVQVSLLLERQQRTQKAKEEDENKLKQIALAPALDGSLWPFRKIYNSDKETISLFQTCGTAIPFLKDDPAFSSLSYLCAKFNAEAAIQILLDVDKQKLEQTWQSGTLILSNLFGWFENNKKEILEFPRFKQDFAKIPIFPSSDKLHKMNELVLPGDFIDELQLTEIVDLSVLGGRREFLKDVGMQVLDFRNYVLTRIPLALKDENVSADKKRALISLLVKRLGEIKDDQDIRNALKETPLIECSDRKYRKAEECYFQNENIISCLANDVHYTAPKGEQKSAMYDLYSWLGVAETPRPADLMERTRQLTKFYYSEENARAIEKIFTYLGGVITKQIPDTLEELCRIAWLPAKGKKDRWYRPDELYAGYQAYLFETQALFLDIPANIQRGSSEFLDAIGVKAKAPINLIVKHLLYCCEKDLPVHQDSYRFLNDNADDVSLNLLKDKKCLYLDNKYLAPNQVFWGEHPFGRFRKRLSEELRSYNNFMQKIGVRDAPNNEDALKVLNEISKEFGNTNLPLDDEAYAVLMVCWRMLEKAYEEEILPLSQLEALCKVKCISNADKILNPPQWMFFENRAGLAAKFDDFLKGNVISRPVGAAQAMAAAGVRTLGSAVEIRLLECDNPSDELVMSNRILQRKNQIGRVLSSQMTGPGALSALNRLDSLQCKSVSSLKISYHLSAFNRNLASDPETVPALYQSDTDSLLFTRKDGYVLSWPAVARELAIALLPDEDPGRIAAGIKEVLSAESVETATASLNELGFAGLDTSISVPERGKSITGLGDDTPIENIQPYQGEESAPINETSPMTTGDALNAILGENTPPPTKPLAGLESEPTPRGGSAGGGTYIGTGKKQSRPVLRSYVSAPGSAEEGDKGEKDADKPGRDPVDVAGVQRVLGYESSSGRKPKEMPHNNPGYDIESYDENGKIVRYIEVKSFSGPWNLTYAVLSKDQFGFGYKDTDLFWLYVVEYAESDEYKLYRIQNPTLKANHFMFDDGWRRFAEDTEQGNIQKDEDNKPDED